MSLVALTETILLATNPASFDRGKEVSVYMRGSEELATLYSAESGGVPLTQPLITDRGGRPRGAGETLAWVEEGSYDIAVDGQRVPWEAARGGGIPVSVMQFKGAWNASTNTPALADGTGEVGDTYRVTVGASRNLGSGAIDFQVGDEVIYDGATWFRIDGNSEVSIEKTRAEAAEAAINKLLEHQATYNVLDYGGTGNDKADDLAAFQAAAAAIPASGGILYAPPGYDWVLSGTVQINEKTIPIIRGQVRRTSGQPMLEVKGSVGADANLTVDAAKGATVLSVATAGLAAGDYINLRSNLSTGAPSGSTEGEILRVKKVLSGAELELATPTKAAYAKADTARIAKLNLLDNPIIDAAGATFTQNEALTEDSTKGYIRFQYCRNPQIRGFPTFKNHEEFAVEFDCCVEPYGEAVMRDMIFDEAKTRYGYGFVFRGPTYGGEVRGFADSAQLGNSGGTTRGWPRNCKIVLLSGSGSPTNPGKSPVSTHSDSEGFTIDATIDGWRDIGMQIKGRGHKIIARKVHHVTGIGIFLVADSKTIYPEDCKIILPDIKDVKADATNIGMGIVAQGVNHKIILPNVNETDAHAIRIAPSASGEPCHGTKVTKPHTDNFSRGNKESYNGVSVKTGVEGVTVDTPECDEAPEGGRLVRIEGGEAGNAGCKLIEPRGAAGIKLYGESEYFALGNVTGVRGYPALKSLLAALGGKNVIRDGSTANTETIAAAETISPPNGLVEVRLTGTGSVKTITATEDGHILAIRCVETAKLIRGGNLELPGNWIGKAGKVILLYCNGSNWYPIGNPIENLGELEIEKETTVEIEHGLGVEPTFVGLTQRSTSEAATNDMILLNRTTEKIKVRNKSAEKRKLLWYVKP